MSRLEAYLDIRERKCNFFQYFDLHFLRLEWSLKCSIRWQRVSKLERQSAKIHRWRQKFAENERHRLEEVFSKMDEEERAAA